MRQSQFDNTFDSEQSDLASWVGEIHSAVYPHLVSSPLLFFLIFHDFTCHSGDVFLHLIHPGLYLPAIWLPICSLETYPQHEIILFFLLSDLIESQFTFFLHLPLRLCDFPGANPLPPLIGFHQRLHKLRRPTSHRPRQLLRRLLHRDPRRDSLPRLRTPEQPHIHSLRRTLPTDAIQHHLCRTYLERHRRAGRV